MDGWLRALGITFHCIVLYGLMTLGGIGCSTSMMSPIVSSNSDTPLVLGDSEEVYRLEGNSGNDFDLLALQSSHFPVTDAASILPAHSRIGVLDWTFGTSTAPIEYFEHTGKVDAWRIHVINYTAVNNGKVYNYDPMFGIKDVNRALESKNNKLMSFLKERAALWCGIIPTDKLYLSPLLEYDKVSQTALRNSMDALRSGCPTAKLVASHRGVYHPLFGNWINEYHGDVPRCVPGHGDCLTSLDGDDVTDIDVPKWVERTKKFKISMVWTRSFNCRNQGDFEDPRKRKSCPTKNQLEGLFRIKDNKVPVPTGKPNGCSAVRNFGGNEILKPYAEDKGSGDVRANYPVFIGATSVNTVSVVDKDGKQIGKFGKYGSFPPNLYRFYTKCCGGSGDSSWDLEKEAKAGSGSPYAYIKIGGTCVGPFVPTRRGGVFR